MSRAVWFAGAAAVLPIATVCMAQVPKPVDAFVPPSEPQILTRTLRHMMHDGKSVVSRRSYRVHFVAENQGFRIEGELLDTAVDAPSWLSGIAELERRRPDPGMFPIMLDASGMIVSAPPTEPTSQHRRGINLAATQIGHMGELDEGARAQAQEFIAHLGQRPQRTSWPRDLFHPAPGAQQDRRTIPLPDGLRGQVTTDILASADPATGLLAKFERRVTTQLEDNRRVVIEEWTLTDAN